MAKLLHIFYHKVGTFSLLCQQVQLFTHSSIGSPKIELSYKIKNTADFCLLYIFLFFIHLHLQIQLAALLFMIIYQICKCHTIHILVFHEWNIKRAGWTAPFQIVSFRK